ncbi:MAG: hypothetical protein ACOYXS_11255 [Chloroflexota bacterium]
MNAATRTALLSRGLRLEYLTVSRNITERMIAVDACGRRVAAGARRVAAGYPLADLLAGPLISTMILVVLGQTSGQMLGRLMDPVDPELVDPGRVRLPA